MIAPGDREWASSGDPTPCCGLNAVELEFVNAVVVDGVCVARWRCQCGAVHDDKWPLGEHFCWSGDYKAEEYAMAFLPS